MATTQDKIAGLYAAFFNRAPDKEGFDGWVTKLDADTATLEDIAAGFAEHATFTSTYGDMDDQAFVEAIYMNVLGQAGDAAGIDNQVAALSDGTYATRADFVAGFVSSALEIDLTDETLGLTAEELAVAEARQATLVNKVEAAQYFMTTWGDATNVADAANPETDASYIASIAALNGIDATAASVEAAETTIDGMDLEVPVEPEDEGNTVYLTHNNDVTYIPDGLEYSDYYGVNTTGTADADTFIARNSQNGAVSNTLSSADEIDGGDSTDTLKAELTNEYDTAGTAKDIAPTTASVENVTFNNIADNQIVTVDAENMIDVVEIGSYMSDGDLVIENLSTQVTDGLDRNTNAITVTMDHTDNFNSDGDASDLTVYFDEDYLLAGTDTSGATLTLYMLNAVSNVIGNNPLEGTTEFNFLVGTETVTVDISSIAANSTLDFSTAYDQVVIAINAQLVEDGFTTVTAERGPIAEGYFSIPIVTPGATYNPLDSAGNYYPIVITNTGSETLTEGQFTTTALEYDTDQNNSMNDVAPATADVPLAVNIELNKVGQEGEGGNLIIGGKEQDTDGGAATAGNGIDEFNITVLGDETKLSNLGVIRSTNAALDKVTIVTSAEDAAAAALTTDADRTEVASLTVRGSGAAATALTAAGIGAGVAPFGGTLETLNANGFLGDLNIGQDTAASNIDTFTAIGGGNVTLVEINNDVAMINNTVTTGAGMDMLTITDNGNLVVDSGAGNDTIVANLSAGVNQILGQSGNDTITVNEVAAGSTAIIDAGAGDDVVNGNNVAVTVNAGLGDDAVYAENTGYKALLNTGTSAIYTTAIPANQTTAETDGTIYFLDGREVTVTIATNGLAAGNLTDGYETSEAVEITASTGTLTSLADLNAAIVEAVNGDDTLSKIATAYIDENNNVQVKYLVDGAQNAAAVEVTITDPAPVISVSTTMLNEYRDLVNNSILTNAYVTGLYNAAAASVTASSITAEGTTLAVTTTAALNDVTTITIGTDVVTVTHVLGTAAGTAIEIADALADAGYNADGTTVGSQVAFVTDETVSFTSTGAFAATQVDDVALLAVNAADLLGSDSTAINNQNVVNGNEGDDVIVLSSDATLADTVEFTGYNQGDDTIVHFETAMDKLDFTSYLTGTVDANNNGSVSAESEFDLTVTTAANDTFTANSINLINMAALSAVTTETFDTLTASQVEALLDADASANTVLSSAATGNGDLYQTNGVSVLVIQDVVNDGEYKAYEVTYADATVATAVAGTFSVQLIGSFDLGDTAAPSTLALGDFAL